MLRHLIRLAPAVASLAIFAIALFALHELTAQFKLHDVLAAMAATPARAIAAAAVFTTASYCTLTLYDVLALRHVGRRLPYGRVALTSFVAYAIGHNVGVVAFSSGAIRYRLYSLAGLDAAEIAQIVLFCAMTFQLGAGVLAGVSLIGESGQAASLLHASPAVAVALGVTLLLAATAWMVFISLRRAPLVFASWQLTLPGPVTALAQAAVAIADLVLAGSVLFMLLPEGSPVSLVGFLGLYVVAVVAGALSTVPGGLGVFESALLLLLPGVPAQSLLGALLLYRLVYYAAPFALALSALTATELAERRAWLYRATTWIRRLPGFVAPQAMALLAFSAGAILLVSGTTPAVAERIAALQRILPLAVLETSHLAASAIGVALLVLARGLYYRNEAAWHAMVWLLGAGIAASLLKGLDWEEALLLGIVLLPLIATRHEFYRRSSLLAEPLAPRWFAAVAMTVAASIWIGLLAHREGAYRNELWWQFAFDAGAPRMLRASLVAMLGVGVVAALRLLQPPRASLARPAPAELERARAIVHTAEDVAGHLALLGDKSLLFSESGRSFVMYAVSGRSWVAMGDPIGPAEERAEMIWRFRELCDREGGWCVFYEVHPVNLPHYVDAGLSLTKLGEEGVVALAGFSLEGSARAPLRQACKRAERDGAGFRVVPPADVPGLLPELRRISDDWLAGKSAGEKGFSLGFFDERYLAECNCALVEKNGRPVAFANLWADEGPELSIDLMRHAADAPKTVMDYLFVQTMLWGRAQGYESFSLGMAPLAGLERHRLAPAWHRFGRLVYRYGEDFYNFEGLRHYKDKFQPQWRPRYLAAPSGLVLPRVLLDVTGLIAGGVVRAVGRGHKGRT